MESIIYDNRITESNQINVMNDEADEVVEEIPVFMAANGEGKLHIFQYPTKIKKTQVDHDKVVNCFIRPINKQVKMEFAMKVDPEVYDERKARQLAMIANGQHPEKGDQLKYPHGLMNMQTYTSSKSTSELNRFVVGIYQGKEIHLSPLTNVVELRPTVDFFNKQEKRSKYDENLDAEKLRPVTVKFASTRVPVKRKQTYSSIFEDVDEPWCDTVLFSHTASIAELERRNLFSSKRERKHSLTLDIDKYNDRLVKAVHVDALGPPDAVRERIVTMKKLKGMPMKDMLEGLLKEGKMMTFTDILIHSNNLSKTEISPEQLLRLLQSVGVIMKGNWIPQSDVLYPPNWRSNSNGIEGDRMARARDYILFKLSRSDHIYRRQVLSTLQLPIIEAEEVLCSVARLDKGDKWALLLPPDEYFVKLYPELVERQDVIWRATESMYMEMDSEQYKRGQKR